MTATNRVASKSVDERSYLSAKTFRHCVCRWLGRCICSLGVPGPVEADSFGCRNPLIKRLLGNSFFLVGVPTWISPLAVLLDKDFCHSA
jgi:hypothetical protein